MQASQDDDERFIGEGPIKIKSSVQIPQSELLLAVVSDPIDNSIDANASFVQVNSDVNIE